MMPSQSEEQQGLSTGGEQVVNTELDAREREALLARPPIRQKFAAADDIVLLKAVNTFRPWVSAVGTSKGIMKVFDDIAIHCRLDKSFGLNKPGTAMRTRFTNLVNQCKADQCQSMRKSGSVEEYAEREVLLQNIVALISDWDEKEAQRKEEQTARQRSIENSGELLRRLAMGEITFEDDDLTEGPSEVNHNTHDEAEEEAEETALSDAFIAATLRARLEMAVTTTHLNSNTAGVGLR